MYGCFLRMFFDVRSSPNEPYDELRLHRVTNITPLSSEVALAVALGWVVVVVVSYM